MEPTPCTSCGACCAFYRVSFYWAEIDEAAGYVPLAMTQQISPFLRAMKGTLGSEPRCQALSGKIGEGVTCTMYAQRPSPCRDFHIAWQDGLANERCDQARRAHGLAPLSPPLGKVA